jgi:hypothetical protein
MRCGRTQTRKVTLHVSGQRREIEARLGSQRGQRLQCDCYATVRRDFIVRWTYSTDWSLSSLCAVKRGWVMSSYAKYCQEQATACARRARLANSPEIVAYCRRLEFRWLSLAEQAHETGGALGHESRLTAALFPLHDKPAAYPAEYAKRAGELIARSARSLHRPRPNELIGSEGPSP